MRRHLHASRRNAGTANRQVAVALASAILVAAVLVAAVLSSSAPRRAGTNGRLLALPVNLKPGARFCQRYEVLPKGTAALVLTVNTGAPDRQGGPLEVLINLPGVRTIRGRAPGGYVTQPVAVALAQGAPPAGDMYGAEVCVRNRGRVTVAVFGERVFPGERAAAVTGRTKDAPARARIDWLRAGEETWFAFAPVIAERYALAKASFFGPWTLPLLAVLGLLTLAGVCVFLVRTLRA